MTKNQSNDFIDRLGEMFELQGDLQRNTYGSHPSDIPTTEERINFIKDMHIAIGDELSEFMGEIGWKPWATSRHINVEAAQGELVDAFHFFMNLCMAVDMTPEILFERYKAKRLKNIKRQEDGYDGVQGKCLHCKRALDDTGVNCYQLPGKTGGSGWCEIKNSYIAGVDDRPNFTPTHLPAGFEL